MQLTASLHQAWPPFVLVTRLLLIGPVANRDGLFEQADAAMQRLPGGGVSLLAASLLLVATATAVLNLDTAVVFLTPVLALAALAAFSRRGARRTAGDARRAPRELAVRVGAVTSTWQAGVKGSQA